MCQCPVPQSMDNPRPEQARQNETGDEQNAPEDEYQLHNKLDDVTIQSSARAVRHPFWQFIHLPCERQP